VLNRVNIRLGSRLKDIFGKAGTEILNGLMAGKTVDSILEQTKNKWLTKRRDEVKAVAKGALSEIDILELRDLTDTIKHLDEKIAVLDIRIGGLVNIENAKIVNEKELSIACSVPGVGHRSAATILAEIGDAKRFSNGKQIASWAGLAPSVHQSAGKLATGHITKMGSKWLRWSMVEVAHAAVRVRDSRFRALFLRVMAKKGKKTAYVAVAEDVDGYLAFAGEWREVR
jgi:transposase